MTASATAHHVLVCRPRCENGESDRGNPSSPSVARVSPIPGPHRRQCAGGVERPSRARQLRHPQNAAHLGVVGQAAALSCPLHPNLRLVVEPRRTVVCGTDDQTDSARQSPQRRRIGASHSGGFSRPTTTAPGRSCGPSRPTRFSRASLGSHNEPRRHIPVIYFANHGNRTLAVVASPAHHLFHNAHASQQAARRIPYADGFDREDWLRAERDSRIRLPPNACFRETRRDDDIKRVE